MTDASSAPPSGAAWHEIMLATLKANDVKLVVYVPDRVFTPLIKAMHADDYLHHLCRHARGRSDRHRHRRLDGRLARRRADADVRLRHHPQRARLAGRALPDPGADLRLRARHARRVQSRPGAWSAAPCGRCSNSLAVEHHTITRHDELAFIVDRSIKQAVATQAPVTFILSPLLTGGKVFAA